MTLLPAQPARDHQVQDEVQPAVEAEDDPLAETLEALDDLPLDRGGRRVDAPEEERAREAQALEPVTEDAPLERLDVDDDVRQFGHAGMLCHRRAREDRGPEETPKRGGYGFR